jgi:hypothetical protein
MAYLALAKVFTNFSARLRQPMNVQLGIECFLVGVNVCDLQIQSLYD